MPDLGNHKDIKTYQVSSGLEKPTWTPRSLEDNMKGRVISYLNRNGIL